jgi:hypothetical protein
MRGRLMTGADAGGSRQRAAKIKWEKGWRCGWGVWGLQSARTGSGLSNTAASVRIQADATWGLEWAARHLVIVARVRTLQSSAAGSGQRQYCSESAHASGHGLGLRAQRALCAARSRLQHFPHIGQSRGIGRGWVSFPNASYSAGTVMLVPRLGPGRVVDAVGAPLVPVQLGTLFRAGGSRSDSRGTDGRGGGCSDGRGFVGLRDVSRYDVVSQSVLEVLLVTAAGEQGVVWLD